MWSHEEKPYRFVERSERGTSVGSVKGAGRGEKTRRGTHDDGVENSVKGAGRGGQTSRGTLTQLRGHEAKGSDQAGYDSRVTLVNPRIGDRAIDSG